VESMCPNWRENGKTKLLLTSNPHSCQKMASSHELLQNCVDITSWESTPRRNSRRKKRNWTGRGVMMTYGTNCLVVIAPVEANMKLVSVPHVKEVFVIVSAYDSCGHKTKEEEPRSKGLMRRTRTGICTSPTPVPSSSSELLWNTWSASQQVQIRRAQDEDRAIGRGEGGVRLCAGRPRREQLHTCRTSMLQTRIRR